MSVPGDHRLEAKPLTQAGFSPFGDVIETEGHASFLINDGSTHRYHDLAKVDVSEAGGRPLINVFRADPLPLPHRVQMMERHPLSSQAFIPLAATPFLVLVAPLSDSIEPDDLRLFLSNGKQGVNYRRNIWHHPVLALMERTEFVVIDRGGEEENCDVYRFEGPHDIVIADVGL